MSFSTPRTWTTSELITAAIMNQHIRDNFSAIWVGTTNGDIEYYTGATEKARLGIGSTGQILNVASGVPAWITPFTWLTTRVGNTDWDGDAKASGTLDIAVNDFNSAIPNTAKAVFVTISSKWSTVADGNYVLIRNASAAGGNGLVARSQAANIFSDANGIVTLNDSGEMRIDVGANTTATYIEIWGYSNI